MTSVNFVTPAHMTPEVALAFILDRASRPTAADQLLPITQDGRALLQSFIDGLPDDTALPDPWQEQLQAGIAHALDTMGNYNALFTLKQRYAPAPWCQAVANYSALSTNAVKTAISMAEAAGFEHAANADAQAVDFGSMLFVALKHPGRNLRPLLGVESPERMQAARDKLERKRKFEGVEDMEEDSDGESPTINTQPYHAPTMLGEQGPIAVRFLSEHGRLSALPPMPGVFSYLPHAVIKQVAQGKFVSPNDLLKAAHKACYAASSDQAVSASNHVLQIAPAVPRPRVPDNHATLQQLIALINITGVFWPAIADNLTGYVGGLMDVAGSNTIKGVHFFDHMVRSYAYANDVEPWPFPAQLLVPLMRVLIATTRGAAPCSKCASFDHTEDACSQYRVDYVSDERNGRDERRGERRDERRDERRGSRRQPEKKPKKPKPAAPGSSSEKCRKFAAGECTYGAKCKYQH